MSLKYPVYSNLPLSPASPVLSPCAEKVNMMCHSDVVKPLYHLKFRRIVFIHLRKSKKRRPSPRTGKINVWFNLRRGKTVIVIRNSKTPL